MATDLLPRVSAVGGANPYQACEEYNSNINVITAAAFSSGGTPVTSPFFGTVGGGGESAGLKMGDSARSGSTEEYNGTSWSEQNNMNTGRHTGMGAGPQTASFYAGGVSNPSLTYLTAVENYDGSSWTTAPGSLPASVAAGGACGTQTAGLIYGGLFTAPFYRHVDTTNEYDGTNITTGGSLNTARRGGQSAGTQTAGLYVSGNNSGGSSTTTNVEEYNGTSWSEVNNIPSAINFGGLGSLGTQTAAFQFGGVGGSTTTTSYDGTNFSANPSLSTSRTEGAGAGTGPGPSFFVFGGTPPGATEEFNEETQVITASTLTTS